MCVEEEGDRDRDGDGGWAAGSREQEVGSDGILGSRAMLMLMLMFDRWSLPVVIGAKREIETEEGQKTNR